MQLIMHWFYFVKIPLFIFHISLSL
jgi:hypothetical protein